MSKNKYKSSKSAKGKQQPKKSNPRKTKHTAEEPMMDLSEQGTRKKKQLLIASLVLIFLAVGLYWQTWEYEYTLDDMTVLAKNQFVQKGIGGIQDIFSTHHLAGYNENLPAIAYRPIALLSLAIQHEISGDIPSHFHIGNILIYALLGVILFISLQIVLKKYPLYIPFIISLLFILHPVHTEMVANIKNRDEMLGFLFFFTSLYYILKYYDQKKQPLLWLSVIFYFLSLASKESMITTIILIPLIFYFFRKSSIKNAIIRTIPYIIVLFLFIIIRQTILNTDQVLELNKIANPLLAAENEREVIGTILLYFGKFLVGITYPYNLAGDYSYNSIDIVSLENPYVLLSLIVNLGLIAVAFRGFKNRSKYSFAILLYFVTISITLNGFLSGYNAYADRFLFTPSLGLCFLIGFAIMDFVNKTGDVRDWPKLKSINLIPLTVLLVIAVLSTYKIKEYSPVWKNNMSLFQYCVEKTPMNARMRKSLGGEYTRMALAEKDSALQRQYSFKAIDELTVALNIYEKQSTGYSHLGINYGLIGDMANAEKALKRSLAINPFSNVTNVALANVLYRLNKYEEAIKYYLSADSWYLKKDNFYLISQSYRQIGDDEKADYFLRLSSNEE